MDWQNKEQEIPEILKSAQNIAIVGISDSPDRDSNKVASYLQDRGYRIFPVNPKYAQVLGEKCYSTLSEIPEKIDVVDIFRKPEHVLPIVQEAVKINASVVWMQLGVVNEEAARLAEAAGLKVIMNRCLKIEHRSHS
jgi:predicted CoA-binding protein